MLWCKGLKEENSTSFFPTYLNNAGSIHYHPGNIPYMKPLCILFHYTELLRPTKKGFFSYPHMITANSIPQHSGTVGQQLLPVLNEPKGGGGMGWQGKAEGGRVEREGRKGGGVGGGGSGREVGGTLQIFTRKPPVPESNPSWLPSWIHFKQYFTRRFHSHRSTRGHAIFSTCHSK